ncbi:MAG: shikimate dehydrogenase [Acidobacteriota bacterium]|nr:shikimate dehydrogenase [Acidobacteriota bacterium]
MREPLVCVTVTGRTMAELRHARDAAAHADLVELRLDSVDRPDAAGAVEGRRRPVIVTCRAAWEGGAFGGSEEDRERLLTEAQAAGAEYVDVEARAEFVTALVRRRRGRGIVLSMHAFGDVPADLGERALAMRSTGAEIVKIAIAAERLADTVTLMDLARHPALADADEMDGHVLIAMGPAGVPSRILAARLQNRWTYAGDGVAPGQIPVDRLLSDFRFRRIRPDAALYGVVGNPIAHSLSPVMHNAGFAALGLNAAYVPLHAADVDDFAAFARSTGMRGASITAPFKVAMLGKVDETDPVATRVGAVNTLVVRDGRWFGANSDVEGFLAPLAGRMALKGTRASVLGSGGAARAVAVALVGQGAAVTVCARRADAAREVARLSDASAGAWPPRPGSWDVLVNATSCGSRGPDDDPMAGVALDGEIVFDLVYVPAETPLLKRARAEGCLTIGGLEMLVAQAERQFELWTGQRPPAGLFAAAAMAATGDRPRETQAEGSIT